MIAVVEIFPWNGLQYHWQTVLVENTCCWANDIIISLTTVIKVRRTPTFGAAVVIYNRVSQETVIHVKDTVRKEKGRQQRTSRVDKNKPGDRRRGELSCGGSSVLRPRLSKTRRATNAFLLLGSGAQLACPAQEFLWRRRLVAH